MFVRTILREFNHLMNTKEITPLAEDLDCATGDKLIKIMKGGSTGIIKLLMELNEEKMKKTHTHDGEHETNVCLAAYNELQANKITSIIDEQLDIGKEDEDGLDFEDRSKLRKLLR